jgi:hypothetical protein
MAGIVGAAAIQTVGAHYLGIVGTALIFLALAVCELATWRIAAACRSHAAVAMA